MAGDDVHGEIMGMLGKPDQPSSPQPWPVVEDVHLYFRDHLSIGADMKN